MNESTALSVNGKAFNASIDSRQFCIQRNWILPFALQLPGLVIRVVSFPAGGTRGGLPNTGRYKWHVLTTRFRLLPHHGSC